MSNPPSVLVENDVIEDVVRMSTDSILKQSLKFPSGGVVEGSPGFSVGSVDCQEDDILRIHQVPPFVTSVQDTGRLVSFRIYL